MTYRATITDGTETIVMMFGDSYKSWRDQFREFMFQEFGKKGKGKGMKSDLDHLSVTLEKSRSKWVGWGGLKWCAEQEMQNELNREGCQETDPDNPKPRQYEDFRFSPLQKSFQKFL